ncbi:MAG: phospholipase D-like domain-containing protein [Candidatus Eremiobacteraeota bacterium]|nr:phospholipase D-like domain-containing protein [Candidatus Eremiobacteraeota bacterium]
MLALSSTTNVVAAMHRAHSIVFTAYVLGPGRIRTALQRAAAAGARVVVRLEGRPYADSSGALQRLNADTAASLRAQGADASLCAVDGAPLHLKSAVIDGAEVFLDDRNWPGDGRDTIVRDTDARDVRAVESALRHRSQMHAALATRKGEALALETGTIHAAGDRAERIDVQTESFGYGRVYTALLNDADAHLRVRLMVAQRDLSARARSALDKLSARGVTVRISQNDEKMAVTADEAWLGSANATGGVEDQLDWGLRISEPGIISALQSRFNASWKRAVPYTPRVSAGH